jgi:hypothetical protein
MFFSSRDVDRQLVVGFAFSDLFQHLLQGSPRGFPFVTPERDHPETFLGQRAALLMVDVKALTLRSYWFRDDTG